MNYKKLYLIIAFSLGGNVGAQATLQKNIHDLWQNKTELATYAALTAGCSYASYAANSTILRTFFIGAAALPTISLFTSDSFLKKVNATQGFKQVFQLTKRAKNIPLIGTLFNCENIDCTGVCSTCKSRKMVQLLPLAMIPFALGSLLKKLFTSAIAPEDGNTIVEEPEINDLPDHLSHSSIDKSESEEVQKEPVTPSVNERSSQTSDVAAENQIGDGTDETNAESNYMPSDSDDAEESDSDEDNHSGNEQQINNLNQELDELLASTVEPVEERPNNEDNANTIAENDSQPPETPEVDLEYLEDSIDESLPEVPPRESTSEDLQNIEEHVDQAPKHDEESSKNPYKHSSSNNSPKPTATQKKSINLLPKEQEKINYRRKQLTRSSDDSEGSTTDEDLKEGNPSSTTPEEKKKKEIPKGWRWFRGRLIQDKRTPEQKQKEKSPPTPAPEKDAVYKLLFQKSNLNMGESVNLARIAADAEILFPTKIVNPEQREINKKKQAEYIQNQLNQKDSSSDDSGDWSQ